MIAAFAVACAERAAPPSSPVLNQEASPDLVLRDARLLRLIDGKVVAQVSANELRYRREGGKFQADGVRAVLLPGPQARALDSFGAVTVLAPFVSGDSATREARGQGGVSARAARGDVARGESVVWSGDRHLLESDRPVSIEGAGYTLGGGSLLATTDGSRFELGRGAHGTLSKGAR